jgi:hypothetical protein
MMRSSFAKVISILLSLVLVLITTPVTAVPRDWRQPPKRWLEFNAPSKLIGLQIVGSKSDKSTELVLLKQFGICNTENCFKPDPRFALKNLQLGCEDNLCLFFHNKRNPDRMGKLRIVAQFQSSSYPSEEISYLEYTENEHYVDSKKVTIVDGKLKISQNSQPQLEKLAQLRDIMFWPGLGLTLIIELIIWNLYLRRNKFGSRDIYLILPIVSIVHAVSYPIVCLYLPALHYFTQESNRECLLIVSGFSMLYICCLWIRFRIEKYPRVIITTIGSINQLALYAKLGVGELWRYDGAELIFYQLRFSRGEATPTSSYTSVDRSPTFPMLSSTRVLEFLADCQTEGVNRSVKMLREWVQLNRDAE